MPTMTFSVFSTRLKRVKGSLLFGERVSGQLTADS